MGEAVQREAAMARTRQGGSSAWVWLSSAIFIAAIMLAAQSSNARDVDQSTSEALTSYLKQNRLPLVGAQVIKENDGLRRVVLYGFVATDQGKRDAERRTIAYLGDPAPAIDDRLVIKPELATMTGPQPQDQGGDTDAQSTGGNTAGGAASFEDLYRQIQQYGIRNPPGE